MRLFTSLSFIFWHSSYISVTFTKCAGGGARFDAYVAACLNYKPEEDTIYIVPNRSIEKYF